MALLRWDAKYLLGQAQFDDEHQRLFELINNFYDAFMLDHDRATVLGLLDRVVEHIQLHFANEEALMQESGFPGLDAHRAQHRILLEQVQEVNAKFRDRSVNPTHATVLVLRNCLGYHIIRYDLVFGAYLKSRQGR